MSTDYDSMFSEINYGSTAFAGDLGAAADPEPAAAPAPEPAEDTAPSEHYSILDTPVAPPAPPKGKRKAAMQTQLEGLYAMAGTALMMVDPQTSAVVLHQAPHCAAALYELSQKNDSVRAALESMLATSAWSAVIAAHLPIAVQLGTKYVPELRRRYSATVDDSAAA